MHITYVHPMKKQLHDWFKYKVVTEYAEHGYSTEYAYVGMIKIDYLRFASNSYRICLVDTVGHFV
jgi:hypothetical protein